MKTKFFLRGMTLMEMLFAVAIMTVVMGGLFSFALVFQDTSNLYQVQATNQDEARRALRTVMAELRGSVYASIVLPAGGADKISYTVPADLDGNGTPVDAAGRLETSTVRTITRDTNDVNGDTFTGTQLVLVSSGQTPRILANGVSELNETETDGVFGDANDTNKNGIQDRGIWFESTGRGIRITLEIEGKGRPVGGVARPILSRFQETVFPRN